MQDDGLRVDVSDVDGIIRVTVCGEIDAYSAIALRAPLEQLSLERLICVDLAGVRFMDSTGLTVLLTQRERMAEVGGSMHVCNASDAVRRLVEVTGLREVLLEPTTLP